MILAYHRIAEDPTDAELLCVTPARFEMQLQILSQLLSPIDLPSLLRRIELGKSCAGMVAITFDDGYRDVLFNAVPLLRKYGIRATCFITSGYIGNPNGFLSDQVERMFFTNSRLCDDRLRSLIHKSGPIAPHEIIHLYDDIQRRLRKLRPAQKSREFRKLSTLLDHSGRGMPNRSVLTKKQLVALSADMDIGAHSVTHSMLSMLSYRHQTQEIQRSKDAIEHLLGHSIEHFAYPYGTPDSFSEHTANSCMSAGFAAAFTTNPSNNLRAAQSFCMPRFVIRNYSLRQFEHLITTGTFPVSQVEARRQRNLRLLRAIKAQQRPQA